MTRFRWVLLATGLTLTACGEMPMVEEKDELQTFSHEEYDTFKRRKCPATCPKNRVCDPFRGYACVTVKGRSYYVDFRSKVPWSRQNGTFSRPWSTMEQVNKHRFNDGDDLFFRAGTGRALTEKLKIDWDGSDSNRVVIGAYYGKGLFGLGGKPRPVLRGSYRRGGKNVPPGDYDALIQYARPGGYITIRDLAIIESYAGGVAISSGHKGSISRVEVSNCVIKDLGRQGISLGSTHHSLIEGNHVEQVCQRKIQVAKGSMKNSGAAIVLMGGNKETKSMYNTIRGNTVARYFEGIGVYRGPRYTIIEDNVVYDGSDMAIYIDNSRDATIKNNVVYNPATIWHTVYSGARNGIQLDSEGHLAKAIKVAGNHEVYENYVAGMNKGIVLASRSNRYGAWQQNNRIYKNRVVDCIKNFSFAKSKKEKMADVVGWKNNLLSKNASFIFSAGTRHTNVKTWPGVTWDGNHFNTQVAGDAAKNAVINAVKLRKTKGWRDLTPGKVGRSDFAFKE